jgi:hypothetical protein
VDLIVNELFVKQLRTCGGSFEENDQMSISGVQDVEESCLSAATAESKAGVSDIVKNKLAMFLRRVFFVREFKRVLIFEDRTFNHFCHLITFAI